MPTRDIEDEMRRVTCIAQAIKKPDDIEGALRMRLAFLCMAAVTHNDEGMRELTKELIEFVKTRIAAPHTDPAKDYVIK